MYFFGSFSLTSGNSDAPKGEKIYRYLLNGLTSGLESSNWHGRGSTFILQHKYWPEKYPICLINTPNVGFI